MKFKIGDKVKLNPKLKKDEFIYGKGLARYDDIGEVINVSKTSVTGNFPEISNWFGVEAELVPVYNFEVGDMVQIRKDCSLEELTYNYWNGCQTSTMNFLKQESFHDFDNVYTVKTVDDECLNLLEYHGPVNRNLFELVKKKEDTKKMTLKEICDVLGYDIEIIKEEN